MQQRSRYQTARRILIFWTLFIGIGAVGGALMMLLDPSGKTIGMDAMLPYFQVLPFAEVVFQDLTFSGWALLSVNGLSNLTAAALLLARKSAGVVLGGIFGVTLMLWIGIQFYMFPLNFMSTAYFIFGLCQTAAGYAAWVFRKREAFTVNRADYPHIGDDPTRLVVFFSRMGYVRKQAYAEANRTGAAVYEIREADYIPVHHQKDTYENAAEEMDRLLGVTHTSLHSIQCREGIYKETSKRKEMIV